MLEPAVEARAMRENHWNVDGMITFPVDPFKLGRSLGIVVRHVPLKPDTAGFIIRENGETNVFLNRNDLRQVKRFTMAHELGHFVQFQEETVFGFVDKRDEVSAAAIDPKERWANSFAAELIMPKATLLAWWADGRSVEEILSWFDVTESALANRLNNLGLLND